MTSAVGSELLVNTATANEQRLPTISRLANGGFVIAWQDGWSTALGGNAFSNIKGQAFDAAGEKVGSELLVNTDFTHDKINPKVTSLSNGEFVVTWQDGTGGGQAVHAQLFDSAGRRLGSNFLVNSQMADFHGAPAITGLANGSFAVVWQDQLNQNFQTESSINVQLFDPAGDKIGSQLLVAHAQPPRSYLGGLANPTITHLSNGGFVVTWEDSLWA